MNFIKKFINGFRDSGNQKKGWLGIKGHYIDHSIQKHIVIGLLIFITISVLKSFSSPVSIAIEIGVAWTVVFGVIKEVDDQWIGAINKMIGNTGRTGANIFDFIGTVFIPIMIQLINLHVI